MGVVAVAEQPVQALDLAGVAVEAADGFQCFVADTQALVWPVCPRHGNGAHPALVGDTAVWTCRTGDHVLGPIIP
jgi:hypothetical protein